MPTSTVAPARSKRKPVERGLRFAPPAEGRPAVLALAVGQLLTHYAVYEIPSELGEGERGFELHKLNTESPDRYHARLATDAESSCCCKGFEKYGYRHPCKHLAALRTLAARGDLPPLTPPPATTIALVADQWAKDMFDAGLDRMPTDAEVSRAA